jgi:hypothetical protein
MSKTTRQVKPTSTHDLSPERTACPHCGTFMRADYTNHRTLSTLTGVARLNLTIRRCHHDTCPALGKPYRPEAEGHFALPHYEFGLDLSPESADSDTPNTAPFPRFTTHSAKPGSGSQNAPSPIYLTATMNSLPSVSPTTAACGHC